MQSDVKRKQLVQEVMAVLENNRHPQLHFPAHIKAAIQHDDNIMVPPIFAEVGKRNYCILKIYLDIL